VLKTRMQSQKGAGPPQGLRQCLADILMESEVKGLWKGATPRLVRLSVSMAPVLRDAGLGRLG
jgi:solute carrier family 25 (mitochondrial citrate transporter), member 1